MSTSPADPPDANVVAWIQFHDDLRPVVSIGAKPPPLWPDARPLIYAKADTDRPEGKTLLDPPDAQERINSLRAALNQIAYSRSTETPGQFVEALQKMARDALIDYRRTFPEWRSAVYISKADADDWLRSRGAIIKALEKAGLCLWSNAEGFWIEPAPAVPVAWQQTSADSKPLWRYDSFSSTPEQFDYSRPLHATPVHAPAPADDVHHGLDNDRQVLFYEQDFYVLSNFSSFTLYWGGLRFDTSEAAYHYEKFPGHPAIRAAVKNAPSAHEAFKIAEGWKPERRADWDAVKVGIMRDILRAKADQHYYVRRKLLDTGDRKLIENSWRDDFWGWGPNRDGKNMLGNLWMDIRAELRLEAARRALKGKS